MRNATCREWFFYQQPCFCPFHGPYDMKSLAGELAGFSRIAPFTEYNKPQPAFAGRGFPISCFRLRSCFALGLIAHPPTGNIVSFRQSGDSRQSIIAPCQPISQSGNRQFAAQGFCHFADRRKVWVTPLGKGFVQTCASHSGRLGHFSHALCPGRRVQCVDKI